MAVTLKDIADALGMSISTVSRALSNKGRISEETRSLVFEQARKMGYAAKSPTGKRVPANIGIVFSNRLHSLIQDPFYSTVMVGVEQECSKYNYQVTFLTIDDEDGSRIWALYNEQRIDGLIMVGGDIKQRLVHQVLDRKIPLVLIDNRLEELDVNCIVTDNRGGVRKLMKHLYELGHRRIGFIGGPLTHSSLNERFRAYREFLGEAGVRPSDQWIWTHEAPGPQTEKGYEGIKVLAKGGLQVTALITDNDNTAIGVLRGCAELGIRVPDELSIAGFDNTAMAEHVSPALTTVHIHKMEMGEFAARRLHEIMSGVNSVPVVTTLATSLICRQSARPLTA
jgi:DNA-binding LacI/PurR family transcriptional regulator